MKLNLRKLHSAVMGIAVAALSAVGIVSCDETQSYAELLTTEEHAVNSYLADHQVIMEVKDSTFIGVEDVPKAELDSNRLVYKNVPFYRLDEDGFVYMQVVRKGDKSKRPKKGDKVYFMFERLNLNHYAEYKSEYWEGNSDNLANSTGSTSFVYGNTTLPSSSAYGEGIQLPLDYLGYDSEVNVVVMSPMGFSQDVANCTAYMYNIRYFKAQY